MPPCPTIVPTPWHPSVGVFIGALGLLGVLAPLLREHIGRTEKAVWTIVLTVCLILELRSIHLEEVKHDREQDFAVCQQLHSFQAIADTLGAAVTSGQKQYDTTIQHLDKVLGTTQAVAEISKKNLDSVSGGRSYAYIVPQVTNSGYDYAMAISNGGPNVLTGIEVRIAKIIKGDCDYFLKRKPGTYVMDCTFDDGPMHPIAVGSLSGHETVEMPSLMDVGPDGSAKYLITITAQNGHSIEFLQFRKAASGTGAAFKISVARTISVRDGGAHYAPIREIDWTEPSK
jgi:hypothetical protein